RNIQDFVSRGGVVIADSSPGLMDQHCAWQTSESVNQLFGVATVASDKREIKLLDADVRLRVAEPDLKPLTGAALMNVGPGHAAIVNSLGKGWTIYLNTVWDQYPKQRAHNFGGVVYREVAKAVFEKARVRPAIEVVSPDGQPVSQAQTARYQFGDTEVVAIVKENVELKGIVGRDGVTTY